jgi:hypothetical protein
VTFRLLKLCLSAAIVLAGGGKSIADLHTTHVPRYDAAVAKGVADLQANRDQINERAKTLVAYALLKAGVELTDAVVAEGIEIAKARAENKGYTGYNQIYLAGVDAMLLAEVDPQKHKAALQMIANFVSDRQHPSGGWSESQTNPDTSMAQYAMLALWAAHRAGATISPETVDRSIAWHLATGTSDGGWEYRPHQKKGRGHHNMVVAGAGSLAIGRLILHGPRSEAPAVKRFGVLEKSAAFAPKKYGFPNYQSKIPPGTIDAKISRAFDWLSQRFPPPLGPPDSTMPYYFFYAFERAAALYEPDDVQGKGWFETYGDVLLTMQNKSGAFDRGNETYTSASEGTSFAILYFMRSTQQILDRQYGSALQRGNRGNPLGEKPKKEETKSLDTLLSSLEAVDLNSPELNNAPDIADELIRSVQSIKDREQLIGQVDRLKTLVRHPDPDVRQPVYWALGRTSDLSLVPLLLKGLRDPNVDVSVEAEHALRYIARKPQGLGLSDNPLAGAEKATDAERLKLANQWRDRAVREWAGWYREVCSFEESASINELELLNPSAGGGQ